MNERIKELLEEAERNLTEKSVYERFAELVAANEREACAKLCDELRDCEDNPKAYRNGADWCGVRIRARGEMK